MLLALMLDPRQLDPNLAPTRTRPLRMQRRTAMGVFDCLEQIDPWSQEFCEELQTPKVENIYWVNGDDDEYYTPLKVGGYGQRRGIEEFLSVPACTQYFLNKWLVEDEWTRADEAPAPEPLVYWLGKAIDNDPKVEADWASPDPPLSEEVVLRVVRHTAGKLTDERRALRASILLRSLCLDGSAAHLRCTIEPRALSSLSLVARLHSRRPSHARRSPCEWSAETAHGVIARTRRHRQPSFRLARVARRFPPLTAAPKS